MKTILIIGMGRFGQKLAKRLSELDNEIMIVDRNEAVVEELSPLYTDAHIGECTNPAVLESLGINNFDICYVAVGDDFQSSLEITSLLKEAGAKFVVSRAKTDIQEKFLLRNGADEVMYPEKDMIEKIAIRHSAKNIFDYIELTPEYSVFEIPILSDWAGKSLSELNVRNKYAVNVVAIKREDRLSPMPGADSVFCEGDHIVVVAKQKDVFKLTSRT